MGQGWKPRGAFLRTLLIALTVQGVTPDPHDLASRSLIGLFFAQADDRDSGLGDDAPTGDHDPDEVCSPATPSSLTIRGASGCMRLAGLVPSGRDVPPIPLPRQPLPSARWLKAPAEADLLHSLCRLTC